MNVSQLIALPLQEQPSVIVNGHGNGADQTHREFLSATMNFVQVEEVDSSRDDWPHDLIEAYARPRGPFTIDNAEALLDEAAVELYNGWLVEQEMTSPRERRVVATIQSMLDVSARKAGFGQMLPDQLECLLDDGSVIKPDCSLISWQRLDNHVITTASGEHQILKGCPEFVVESRSPSNWRAQEKRKRQLYFAHGVQIVWDVDEENQEIWVWYAHSPDNALHFTRNDEIHCTPILPGWRRRVVDIFAEHTSAEAVVGEVVDIWRNEGRVEGVKTGKAEGIEIGKAEGIEIGKAEGIEIGKAEGIEIGKAEGIEEGSTQTARELLLTVLTARFSTAPQELIQQIQRIRNLDQLKTLLQQATVVGSLEQFEHILETSQR